jgi:hypothetical protein
MAKAAIMKYTFMLRVVFTADLLSELRVLWKGGLPARDTSKQKPSVAFSDFNDVALGSSAIFQNLSLRKRRKDREPGVKRTLQDPWLSVPIFQWFWLYTVYESPPLGITPREAKIRILEIGPLHNYLEKGVSEPSGIGNT